MLKYLHPVFQNSDVQFSSSSRRAVGRGAVAGIIIVLVVLAGGAYYYLGLSGNQSTTSTSSTTSSTSAVGGVTRDTLTIDDVFWPGAAPVADLNQLAAIGEVPYPDWLTYTVYQPMITVDPSSLYSGNGLKYVPALADWWTQSTDGQTYTFHLRHVNFSSGNPLNSYQVWAEMYGFYYLSGNSSSFLESYNVFDFSKVNFGPATIQMLNQSGLINPSAAVLSIMQNTSWPIYVTNSTNIVFHLAAPFNYFLGTLIVYVGLVFDTQWLLQHGGWGTPSQFNSYFNLNPIPGTGPYKVTQVVENSFVKFTQDPNYWGKSLSAAQLAADPYLDPGHAKNVVVNANFDDVSRFTDLSTGKAQIAGILSQDYGQILSNPNTYGHFLFPDKAA